MRACWLAAACTLLIARHAASLGGQHAREGRLCDCRPVLSLGGLCGYAQERTQGMPFTTFKSYTKNT